MKLEGNGFSQLVQVIRTQGYNKDVEIGLATIKQVSPLVLVLEKNGLELDKDDFMVTEAFSKLVLTIGEQVIVLCDNDFFYVLDRAVKM